ncbi:uncharacterized protein LOC143302139 [Babylonia areolata]|uniref:uncharacterized protein LOC143302139 n=1 Tax=Babylonia areolata TaxID=304850 RepID=UPI003FD565E8
MGVPSYRAPETMLECPTRYAMAGDVWGVGCVLLFALLGRHFFTTKATGSRDAMKNIIHQVCSTLGKPPGHMLDTAGDFEMLSTVIHADGLPKSNSKPLLYFLMGELNKKGYSRLEVTGVYDLIRRLLTVDPDVRIRPSTALTHKFLKDIR